MIGSPWRLECPYCGHLQETSGAQFKELAGKRICEACRRMQAHLDPVLEALSRIAVLLKERIP